MYEKIAKQLASIDDSISVLTEQHNLVYKNITDNFKLKRNRIGITVTDEIKPVVLDDQLFMTDWLDHAASAIKNKLNDKHKALKIYQNFKWPTGYVIPDFTTTAYKHLVSPKTLCKYHTFCLELTTSGTKINTYCTSERECKSVVLPFDQYSYTIFEDIADKIYEMNADVVNLAQLHIETNKDIISELKEHYLLSQLDKI